MRANGLFEADPLTLFRWFGTIALALLLGLLAVLWNEIPRWRASGTNPAATPTVKWGAELLHCPENRGRIAIFGDSHVTGDRTKKGAIPFGRVLERRLPGGIQVALHGVGGDTVIMGEQRWLGKAAGGDLVILAYGSNDAAPRGWLRSKRPVGIAAFTGSLQRQINHWRSEGSRVALLAPPPGGSESIAARMAPYRQAVMSVGKANGVPVMDPADAFAGCGTTEPMLSYDALHMTAAGHACLGEWLALQLCPSPH